MQTLLIVTNLFSDHGPALFFFQNFRPDYHSLKGSNNKPFFAIKGNRLEFF